MTRKTSFAMTDKQVTVTLPEGFSSIRVEDWGVGPLLIIETNDGFTIAIDSLQLTEHKHSLSINRTATLADGDGPVASIGFDAEVAPEVYCAGKQQ